MIGSLLTGVVGSIVRHGMTAVGGGVVAESVVSNGTAVTLEGAIGMTITVIGLWLSIYRAVKAGKQV